MRSQFLVRSSALIQHSFPDLSDASPSRPIIPIRGDVQHLIGRFRQRACLQRKLIYQRNPHRTWFIGIGQSASSFLPEGEALGGK